MQIVIDIPEELYDWVEHTGVVHHEDCGYIGGAILDGIVLPKGHGRLIDSNVLWDAFQDLGQDFYEAFDFAEANAVIEEDEREEDNTRDCKNCKHYKKHEGLEWGPVEGIYGCESWKCNFERKDDGGAETL